MNPIRAIIDEYMYEPMDSKTQSEIRARVLALEIPGLVDVQIKEEPRTFRVTPVFATEQDYVWYHLKYNVNSL